MLPVSPHCFQYVDSDLPDGMTLRAWRHRDIEPRTARTGRRQRPHAAPRPAYR
jgi:hypothetical protein